MRWQDVRTSLEEDEAAMEFVSFRLYDKKWTDMTLYAALVLRPGDVSGIGESFKRFDGMKTGVIHLVTHGFFWKT